MVWCSVTIPVKNGAISAPKMVQLLSLRCDVLSLLLDRERSGKSGGPITDKIGMGPMGEYI